MFDKEFYPTPKSVIDQMISSVDLSNKIILEPSAGKGDIVEALKLYGAKELIICEKNQDLAQIATQKADRFLKHDFFEVTKSDISHIDIIVMNPPFSNADKHIMHAWEIAPEGCQIISLCNYSNINNRYSYGRTKLYDIVVNNGNSTNLGDCFSEAERKTEVEVGLIHIFKPGEGENEFEGYFDLNEEQENSTAGIMPFNKIEEVVGRYVGGVKMFDSVIEGSDKINEMISPISHGSDEITFGAYRRNGNNYSSISRDVFKKDLQKQAWISVFNRFNIKKYVTESVMEDINKFVEKQTNVPFTVKNIYKMIEMIIGTSDSRMKKIITEVFDSITRLAYNEEPSSNKNRMYKQGWKTNDEFMVNEKFIVDWGLVCTDRWTSQLTCSYKSSYIIEDLTKALCFVTGEKYDNMMTWRDFLEYDGVKHTTNTQRGRTYKEFGKWYDFNFFQVKCYKKGSVHVKFKSKDVWMRFNQVACEAKGFQLAADFTRNFRRKSKDVKVY